MVVAGECSLSLSRALPPRAVPSAKLTFVSLHSGYVICVYCDDSWDKEGVKAAFVALVKDLGLVSQAYKCDANTILGIDSKHPSKIKSSLYGKNGEYLILQRSVEAAIPCPRRSSFQQALPIALHC